MTAWRRVIELSISDCGYGEADVDCAVANRTGEAG
jgi:hypothetical protein